MPSHETGSTFTLFLAGEANSEQKKKKITHWTAKAKHQKFNYKVIN